MKRLNETTANKLLHVILTEAQKSRTELLAIAKRIYDAKAGILGTDDEEAVVKAIQEISTNSEFNIMNALFKSIAKNEDVRNYIAGFFGEYTEEFLGLGLYSSETSLRKTVARLDIIMKHLKGIGVGVDVLQQVHDKIKPYADQPDPFAGEFSEWWSQNDHDIFKLMETVGLFVPGLGWAFSLGVGLVDAAQYGIEEEYYEIGPAVIFSALPGLAKGAGAAGSTIVSKLKPSWDALGKQGTVELANALTTAAQTGKQPILTQAQRFAVQQLAKVKDVIQPTLNETSKLVSKRVMVGRLAQGKDVFANTGKIALSKGERIMYGLANNIFTGSEIGAKFYAWNKTGNFLEKDAWAPVYDKFIRKTEMEKQINRGLDAALADIEAGGTGVKGETNQVAAGQSTAAANNTDTNRSNTRLPGDDGKLYPVWTYYKPESMSFNLNGNPQQYKIQTDNSGQKYWQLYSEDNNPWSEDEPVSGQDNVQSIFNQNVQPIRQENMNHNDKSRILLENKISNIMKQIGLNKLSNKSKHAIREHVIRILSEAAACTVPFKNQSEGDAFRKWFRTRYPSQAASFGLDATGPFNNETIRKAFCWSSMGSDGTAAGKLYMQSTSTSGNVFGNGTFSDTEIYIVSGMLIALVFGGYLAFRATRSAYRFVKALPQLVKKKGAVDNVVDSIKNGTVLADLSKTIDKLNLSEREKAELKSQIQEPGFGVQLEKELNLIMIEELKKGTISANDFINALNITDPAIINKVNKIEQARTPKTTTTPKSTTSGISAGAGTVPAGLVAQVSADLKQPNVPPYKRGAFWSVKKLGVIEQVAMSDLFVLLGKSGKIQEYALNELNRFISKFASETIGLQNINLTYIYNELFDRLKNSTLRNSKADYNTCIWIHKSHLNAKYFPIYSTWQQDLIRNNVPLSENEPEEYLIQMSAWYLTKLGR